jgi:hypothetical protein
MYNKNSRHICYHEVAHRLRTAASVKLKLQNKTSFIFKRSKVPTKNHLAHILHSKLMSLIQKTRPHFKRTNSVPQGASPSVFWETRF